MKNLLLLIICLVLDYPSVLSQTNPIDEKSFVTIGGIEQWVTIKGTNRANPVILFLHGGPGSPLSPYSDSIFKGWDNDFVLVQWDQRGSGKTYGTYAPEELDPGFLLANPLTVEEMSRDGIELSEHLIKILEKDKIILFGTSWGSVLGANMAAARPDLFHVYIGHSQVVNPSADFVSTYQRLQKIVSDEKDEEAAKILNTIGPPPYDLARNTGKFIRLIKKYERKNSDPSPESWNTVSPDYNTLVDNQIRADADDYSFLHYVGDKNLGVEPMTSKINLLKDNYKFNIPVYLVQGEEDILTPGTVNRPYFEKIEAPIKEYILVPNAAHGFNASVVEKILDLLKKKILPTI